ncbi:unnamed protein product [Sphagnum balticum]
MPSVKASLEYLQRLPLYEIEKPYWCFLPPHEGFDPDTERVDNLEFEEHSDITIQDIRELENKPQIQESGYQVFEHTSKFSHFERSEDVEQYKAETEDFLKDALGAVYAKCYDQVLRKNVVFQRSQLDLADPLHTEGPARGVHNELEDRPLAICDSRSVEPDDLVPADRVMPGKAGEVYYLTYNANHKWYWLEKQTPSEPFVFVMYDTKSGSHARCKCYLYAKNDEEH